MNEDQLIQIIRTEIQNYFASSQFGVAKVPYHTHNGTDSPYISSQVSSGFMSTATYDPAGISQQVVGTTAVQNVSNKTISSSTITTSTFTKPTVNASVQGVIALTGTTPTMDCSLSNVFTITLSGNTTYSVSNVNAGQVFMVEVLQGSGTTYTNTWFSTVTWVTTGGTAPTETAVSNGYTTYGFRCTGVGTYLGYLVGTN